MPLNCATSDSGLAGVGIIIAGQNSNHINRASSLSYKSSTGRVANAATTNLTNNKYLLGRK